MMDNEQIKSRLEKNVKLLTILRNYGLYPAITICVVMACASALKFGLASITLAFIFNAFLGLLAAHFNQWCENKIRDDIDLLSEHDRRVKVKDLNPHK